MLVLTRKRQEQIRIGDNITVSILKIKGNTVRIGIEAPRDVRVVRGELPVFETMAEVTSEDGGSVETVEATPESAEEEATVSELEWVVMNRLATRKKACLPMRRRCFAAAAAANQRSRARVSAATELQVVAKD